MSHYSKKNLGFTLVELLVSISIVVVILTVVIFNQSAYTDKIALRGLSDEVSLAVSQAQVYSIGVRATSTGSSDFSSAYGVTFSLRSSPNGSPTSYIYFADNDQNEFYNDTWTSSCPGGECLVRTSITRGNRISSICFLPASGSEVCGIGRADVFFQRPNTEAKIKLYTMAGGVYTPPSTMKGVKIEFISPKNVTSTVQVFTTGQISVQ